MDRVDMQIEICVGVDWSGSGSEDSKSDLAVAKWRRGEAIPKIINGPEGKRWSRMQLTAWLAETLRPGESTALVGLDFGFGYPRGAAHNIFGTVDWCTLTRRMTELIEYHGTARGVAHSINEDPYFEGHGPFRIEDRNDLRYYVDHGIAYYRMTELFAPQAISQWYLGKGAAVGFSTITGLAALGRLIRLREQGLIDFRVFPFEQITSATHLLVEMYPAILPEAQVKSGNNHERDALRIVGWLHSISGPGDIMQNVKIPDIPGRRAEEVANYAQEEGWIVGVQ